MQLNPCPFFTYPLSVVDEEASTPFSHVPFNSASPPDSAYALELYGTQNYLSDSSSSPTDNDFGTDIQNYEVIEPVLQSSVLFGSLKDKFHEVLAQCMFKDLLTKLR
jgi:hypothetical protein